MYVSVQRDYLKLHLMNVVLYVKHMPLKYKFDSLPPFTTLGISDLQCSSADLSKLVLDM